MSEDDTALRADGDRPSSRSGRVVESTHPYAAALLALLKRRGDCSALRFAAPPEILHGGFFADIIALRFDAAPADLAGDLVLRVMPDNDRSRREILVQRILAEQRFPTPRVHVSGGASAGLGRPFLLMERAPGGSLASGLTGREAVRAFRSVPRLLAEALAALHTIDPEPLARALTTAGWSADQIGVAEILDEIEASTAHREVGGIAAALCWLRATRPEETTRVVCHGDMQPLNLIIEHGRLSAVVDWTNARLAAPAFDVAYTAQTLEQMPIALPAWMQPLRRWFGRRAARQFLAAHAALAPHGSSDLQWYDALHAVWLIARLVELRAREGASREGPTRRNHPWELSLDDACGRVARHTGSVVDASFARR